LLSVFLSFFFSSFCSFVHPSSPLGEGVFIRGRGERELSYPIQSRRKGEVAEWPLSSCLMAAHRVCPLCFSSWW
jgi:hypothetical protein